MSAQRTSSTAKDGKGWVTRPATETVFVKSLTQTIVVTRKPTRKSSTNK